MYVLWNKVGNSEINKTNNIVIQMVIYARLYNKARIT